MERAYALLAPLDAIRRHWVRALGPWAALLLVDRERRVALSFMLLVTSAFLLASSHPLLLLALGPIVLGVPHLFADLRYLVVRQGLHRRWPVWALVFGPLLALSLTADARWGWAAMVGAALAARGSLARRFGLAALALGLCAVAHRYAFPMGLAVAHFHNLFAVFVLWIWRPKKLRLSLIPVAFFCIASAVILFGGYGRLLEWAHGGNAPWTGLDLVDQARTFAPFDTGSAGVPWVVFYAFAQSVHYGLWLRLVPEEARPSKTPRSFKQSARALAHDFGFPILMVASALAVGLAVWAAIDLVTARDSYFRFAMFHGYLEFAAFTLFYCEGSVRRAKDPSLSAADDNLMAAPLPGLAREADRSA